MASIDRSPTSMKGHVTKADAIRLRLPHPHAVMINCIDCTGNDLIDSKNAVACYDGKNAEDCKYCVQVASATKNAQDMAGSGGGELMYQGISSGPGYNTRFTIHCWNDNADITYSVFCMNGSRDLFGCVGLRKGQYCILNKQYTKEEYETLVPRLIEHMRKTGEWGEFFPASMSPFAYNETVAEDHYPLSQAEAKSRGFPWSVIPEDAPVVERFIPAGSLPVDIAAVPDDILNWAIECAATKRPYRIIKQELEFYRKTHTPIPRLHPDERYRQRMALRNPRHLWDRQCAKCAKAIQTTYAPERPEIVYCEECYLKEVY